MNERLYECCALLPDAERKRDVGAFFTSIHGTLNHLLVGDRLWMGRFTGEGYAIQSLDQELYADFAELRAERCKTDAAIAQWVSRLDEWNLANDLCYTAFTTGNRYCMPLWFTLTHFFNHQTHHRGQVTALLSQLGSDPGVTDLVAFPGCVSLATASID